MVSKLFLPRRNIIVPKPPSYVALDMAMDGASATTLFDKSRYRSHGAITGASWATGLHGKALDFDPTIPSYVSIPASYTQLNFTSEAFSLVARVKVDDLTTYREVFCRGAYETDGWRFIITPDGELWFRTNQLGAQQNTYSAAGDITTGSWFTIGLSRSGAAVKAYKNGIDTTTTAGTHINPATCNRAALIGSYITPGIFPLDGKLEFLRILKGIALSASEHLAWHNALA